MTLESNTFVLELVIEILGLLTVKEMKGAPQGDPR